MKFYSSRRFNAALALATLSVIYLFNFVSIYINILASRSLGRQILAYALNITLFCAVFYLIVTIFAYLYSIAFGKKTNSR